MIPYATSLTHWPDVRAVLLEATGIDPAEVVDHQGVLALEQNEISSLLTVAVSTACFAALRERGLTFGYAAGYSVGQFAALYAAEALDLPTTLSLVWKRAQLMNATRAATDGAMLAVIGLAPDVVQEICGRTASLEEPIAIANYNSPGQMTVAGTRRSIESAEPLLREAGAYRVVRLTVSGAWHCELLQPAVERFAEHLSTITLCSPRIPVIDNTTGDFFPDDTGAIKQRLATQLASPVHWQQGVVRLRSAGANEFLEVGFGDMLSRFGFFIDRQAKHLSWESAS
jgi:[acyl-carrier-protein] S-malonyltransferase